jgi:myo-inositol-1(or 4)-monophosphatase
VSQGGRLDRATSAGERADLADIARLVATEAGTLVQAGHRSRPSPDKKGRHDLVTEFDRASEEMILARLGSLSPGVPVVGEEGAGKERTKGQPGLVWYVDPLDGTTNFVHGHPFWCVSIGLMEDEVPVAGAVVAPSLGITWVGWVDPRGQGETARRNGKPCAVSRTPTLEDALVATGFPAMRDHAPGNNFDSFVTVKRAARAVRRCGSAAIDLCMVADGTYDAYWERTLHAWDTVAGSAIVLAAGGKVTCLEGSDVDHHLGNVVASNGLLHAALVEVLRS